MSKEQSRNTPEDDAEMIAIQRPRGIGSVLNVVGNRLRKFYDNRFALVEPVQHTDTERQVILIALQCLADALKAPRCAAWVGESDRGTRVTCICGVSFAVSDAGMIDFHKDCHKARFIHERGVQSAEGLRVTELPGGGIVSTADSFEAVIAAQWPAIQQEARDYIRRMHLRDGAQRDDQKEKFAQAVLASTPHSAIGPRDRRQQRVVEFVRTAFGARNMDRKERAARVLEEALEIAQVEGMTIAEIAKLGNHVYAKSIGVAEQKAGGTSIALLAYCASIGMSADAVESSELQRLLSKPVEYFRARHLAKAAAGVAMPIEDATTDQGATNGN